MIGGRVVFGRLDMRRQSRGALSPLSNGILPAMDRERKEEQRLAFLDFHGYKRSEHLKGTLTF